MTKKIDILLTKRAFNGFFKIDEIAFRHSLFQGGWTPVIKRELFGRGEAVVILLYDLKAEMIVLVEQCRVGALKNALATGQSDKAWLIEPVAGMIDAGEIPLQACVRETQEEAGYILQESDFEFIAQYYPSPGGSDEILHLYAAEVDINLIPDYSGLVEENEDIHLIKLSFKQAFEQVKQGRFNVASTIMSIQWLLYQKLERL